MGRAENAGGNGCTGSAGARSGAAARAGIDPADAGGSDSAAAGAEGRSGGAILGAESSLGTSAAGGRGVRGVFDIQ